MLWLGGGLIVLVGMTLTVGATYQRVATLRDLAATPAPGQLIDVGGHRLHIWCLGSGEPTVILESGLGGSAFSWAGVQRRVAEFTHVCSYDRAGVGYSDAGPRPRTSGRMAEELGSLLDHAHIEQPIVLAAASSGGFIARILASTQPRRVAGLVLIDASHEDQQRRLAAVGVETGVPPSFGFLVRASSFGFLRFRNETLGLNPDAVDPSARQFVRATVHRASRYQALYDETLAWENSAEQVKASRRTLDIPVIVLSAGSWPENSRQIHAELQRDQVTLSTQGCQIIADNAGHDIVGDAPELVIRAIRVMTTRSERLPLACAG